MELESMTMTRRTEPGSCSSVQPSVSPSFTKPNHFFKFILPEAIHGKEMRIPEEFIRRFGSELSTLATITIPDGLVWRLGLKKSDNNVWFCKGWPEFTKYYSLGYGSLLWFDYKGNSKFNVFICDVTATEIYYPSKQHSESPRKRFRQDNEVEHEVIDMDNLDLPSQGKSKKNIRDRCHEKHGETRSKGGHIKKSGNPFSRIKTRLDHGRHERRSKRHRQENEVEVEVVDVDSLNVRDNSHKRHGKTPSRTGCARRMPNSSSRTERLKERAIKAAQKFKSKNPHFTAVLKPSNMYNAFVYVPAWFATEYLRRVISYLNLQNRNGKQWKAACHSHTSSSAMKIGKGWRGFARDNHLQEGDVCVFELIKRKQVVFKVTIFHGS